MTNKGFSHIGLSTLDLDATRDFYENVLKFKAVRCDILKIKEGGQVRHIFFDTGRDQLLAFMEARDVPGVAARYDAGINRGLGVPNAFYHFAFEAGSEAALDEKRNAAHRPRRAGDRGGRPRLGQVDLLQGPQRPAAGVLLLHPQPERRTTRRMQERAEISIRRLGLEGAGTPTPVESVKVG